MRTVRVTLRPFACDCEVRRRRACRVGLETRLGSLSLLAGSSIDDVAAIDDVAEQLPTDDPETRVVNEPKGRRRPNKVLSTRSHRSSAMPARVGVVLSPLAAAHGSEVSHALAVLANLTHDGIISADAIFERDRTAGAARTRGLSTSWCSIRRLFRP